MLFIAGMNTGIQDAHNLAWKIASVVQGIAPSSVLNTYETERRLVLLSSFYFHSMSIFILNLNESLTFTIFPQIAIFNTALSIQNFRAAMAVPKALGLDPAVANSGNQHSYFFMSYLAYELFHSTF